jgi:ribosomal protein S18 acetylase RimI-like enzyme
MGEVRIRDITADDSAPIERLLRRVTIFEPHEVRVANELVAEALGGSRDYLIYVAEETGSQPAGRCEVVGYVCHGHNPVTDAIHDVYWIAVDPVSRGRGIGRRLMAFTEERVRALQGRGVVIETSSRKEYEPARRLYETCGYRRAAEIADFYKPGDHQLVYMKLVAR